MKIVSLIALFASLGAFNVGVAQAQSPDIGESLFTGYCAACHGVDAKGGGDMSNVMTIPAPNLTLLAQRNDGVFPMLNVIHIIDGRTGVRSHGGPMPIFGQVFSSSDPRDENPYGSVLEVRGRVLSLAMYLETIQQ